MDDEFIVGHVPEPPEVTIETVKAALESLRRVVICHPSREEQIRAAVEEEGLSKVVTVTGSPYVPEDVVYITKPGLAALAAGVGLEPTHFQRAWLKQWDAETEFGLRRRRGHG